MFELIFLGTSASAPSVHRNLPAQVVIHNEHRFLVDCGEGTQRQILTSGIGFKRLNRILVTHSHLDHILGIAGLVSTYSRWETLEEIFIYGGEASLERVQTLLFDVVLRGATPPIPIEFIPVKPGIFFETEDFSISAFPVIHRGPDCLGYIFEEKGRRPFLPEKAEELNIPPGPWRRELVNGQAVNLPDGRLILPDMVLGEYRAGAKLVITGDVGVPGSLLPYCLRADALVIESTYLEEEREMAQHFGHLTARMAAELAAQAEVKTLFLTHVSRRYREKDILKEAEEIYPGAMVARDLDTYQIKSERG